MHTPEPVHNLNRGPCSRCRRATLCAVVEVELGATPFRSHPVVGAAYLCEDCIRAARYAIRDRKKADASQRYQDRHNALTEARQS